MMHLIRKYLILIVGSLVTVRVMTALILTIWPDLLTTQLPNGGTRTLGTTLLSGGIEYLLSVVIIYLLYNDMKKERLVNIPILLLTLFSNFAGITLFLLTIGYNKLHISNRYE